MLRNTNNLREQPHLRPRHHLMGWAFLIALVFGMGLTGNIALASSNPNPSPKPAGPSTNVWCVYFDYVHHTTYPTTPPCNNSQTYWSVNQAIAVAGADDEIRVAGGVTETVAVDKPLKILGGFTNQGGPNIVWGAMDPACISYGEPACMNFGPESGENGIPHTALTVQGAFTVTLNNVWFLDSSVANLNGGTIMAFQYGIRLQPYFQHAFSISGRWNIAAPSAVHIHGSTYTALSGTDFVGDGQLFLTDSGMLNVLDHVTIPHLVLQQIGAYAAGITGPGTVDITNDAVLGAGEMTGAGVTNIGASAVVTDVGSNYGAFTIDQRTINNRGTFTWNSGYNLNMRNGATFNNMGTFNTLTHLYISYNDASAGGTFNNSGVFRNPTNTYLQVEKPPTSVVFNNTGNIDVPDAAGVLHFQNGTYNLMDGSTITGAGYAQVGDGNGTWNITGTVNGHNVSVNSYQEIANGITGPGTLNISGNLYWGNSGRLSGSGVTNLLPGSTVSIYAVRLDGHTVNNYGTATFTSPDGIIKFLNNGIFNNYGVANSTNENNKIYAESGQSGTLNNYGTFTKTAGHNFRIGNNSTFVNAGTFNILGGYEVWGEGGQFRQIGGVTNIDADTGLHSHVLPLELQGGVIRGTGSINCWYGAYGTTLNNTGAEISPGATAASAGTLTINCPYTQGANGAVRIELGGSSPGTGYDRLLINGTASLGGALNVVTIHGYVPPTNSQYTVMTYQSHTGTLGSITTGYNPAYNGSDLTITANGTACTTFSDVQPNNTFYPYVTCLVERGAISGYADCTFRPGNNVTRGQLSKIVSLAANFGEQHSEQTFEDVPVGSTFHQFVERMASRGIIGGYPCGGPGEPCVPPLNRPYFRPNNNVTRGQTTKFVSVAAALPAPPQGQQSFEDVPTNSTFWQWIESLSAAGTISGYPCGGPGEPCVPPHNRPYFRPANTVTRGQSAKIVANTFYPNCQLREK